MATANEGLWALMVSVSSASEPEIEEIAQMVRVRVRV
jgi:hypothetical protein